MKESREPKKLSSKYGIICRYFSIGKCNKGDNCSYYHQEQPQEPESYKTKECDHYAVGFCKLGPYCKFKHTRSPGHRDDILPEWYLEYLYEKPMKLIFHDFQLMNPDLIENVHNKIYRSKFSFKINSILDVLNKKVRYFFIRKPNYEEILLSIMANYLKVENNVSVKLREALKTCEEVLLLFYDEGSRTFCGFARISSTEFKDFSISIEWLWKTRLKDTKTRNYINTLDENKLLLESRSGQEIAVDLGNFLCKLMFNKVTEEEKANIQMHFVVSNELIEKAANSIDSEKMANEKNNARNMSNSSIIVTNISSLQVNISQTSEDKEVLSKKKLKRKNRRKISSEPEYESDDTVVLEKEDPPKKKNENIITVSQKEDKVKTIDQRTSDVKIMFKNKLFSDAMKSLANSYLKKKHIDGGAKVNFKSS